MRHTEDLTYCKPVDQMRHTEDLTYYKPVDLGLIDNPMCPCEEEEQTVDHLIFKCKN